MNNRKGAKNAIIMGKQRYNLPVVLAAKFAEVVSMAWTVD